MKTALPGIHEKINLRALDALRGLLATYVLAGHGRWLLWAGWEVWSQTPHSRLAKLLAVGFSTLRYGHEAVMVFFALSGFFIHLNAARALAAGVAPEFAPGSFFQRRIRRLVPPYLFALLLTVVLDLIGRRIDPALYAGTTGDTLLDENFGRSGFGAASVLPALVMLPASLGRWFGSNGPLWSLGYEVVYYLLYPGWLRLRQRNAWLAYGIGVGCLAPVLTGGISTGAFPVSVLVLYPVWLAGAGLAEWLSARTARGWIVPAAITAATVIGVIHLPLPGVVVLMLYVAGGTAIVLIFASLPEAVCDWRISRGWEWLGVCSYSVYICHFPMLNLLSAVAFHFLGGRPTTGSYACAGSGGVLLACVGCFLVGERPFLPRRRQRVPGAPPPRQTVRPERGPGGPRTAAAMTHTACRERVAVIFHRFGPYHCARLAAAAQGCDLLGVEEAAETSEYAWDAVGQTDGFRRATLLAPGERPAHPARTVVRRLEVLLDRERPAAVVIPGWSDPAALAALRWGLRNGVPAVVMSESTAFDEPRRAWKEWIKTRVVRRCAAGLVGGEPHAAYLAALGMPREQIFPGYDAVDNAHFAHGAAEARGAGDAARARRGLPARYFLASSRFVPQKNLAGLLDAYAAYRRAAGPRAWKLVLLGDGPLRPDLTSQAAALDLAADVSMPGFKQYGELPAYYGLAAAFVHASTREPWGLVVNEAMAAGLPVLVSERCGCAADLVADGENGWQFAPGDTAGLSALLARVADLVPAALAAMGAASQRRIADWSPAAFAANLQRAVGAARARPVRAPGLTDRLLFAVLLRRTEGPARRLLPSAPAVAALSSSRP